MELVELGTLYMQEPLKQGPDDVSSANTVDVRENKKIGTINERYIFIKERLVKEWKW